MFHLGCVSLTFSHCQLFHSEQSMRASLAAVSDHLWQISARWLNCQCKWAGLRPHGRNTETWPGDSGLCFQKQMWNGKSSKLLREEQMACWKNCMWNLNDREQQQQPLLSHSDIFNFYPRVNSHLLRANNFHVLLLQCSYLHGVAYPSWACTPALSSALGEPCCTGRNLSLLSPVLREGQSLCLSCEEDALLGSASSCWKVWAWSVFPR